MKTRLPTLILILCLLGCVNLSFFFGPFTRFERDTMLELRNMYQEWKKQTYIPDLEKKAHAGDELSQYRYAFTFLKKGHGTYDQDKAIYWFEKSGDNGYLDGYHKIAYGLDNGTFGFDTNYDPDKILVEKYYRKAADKGFAKSQNNLAILLMNKYGENADLEEVQKLRISSAEGGDLYGIHNLGTVYMYGKNGFEKDLEKALYWFEKAYYRDYQPVRMLANMAWIYAQRKGPDYNSRKAGLFYWKAARRGNTYAMKHVADAFWYKYYGYPRDRDKAMEWYVKAAEGGYEKAQEALGHIYKDKMERTTDPERKEKYRTKAITWFEKSAEQGNAEATTLLNKLKKQEN